MEIKFEELIRWLKAEDQKRKTIKDNNVVPTQDFVLLEETICEECTAEQIYRIANLSLKSTNIKKLANAIIARKDLRYNYCFANDIPGADIRAHGRVIIESKDPEWNYVFARDIPGADVLAHGQVIIESKDPIWICLFAMDIPGADVLAHAQAIYKFSKDDKTADSRFMLNSLNSHLKSEDNTRLLFDYNGCPIEIVPIIDNRNLSKL